jgi:hypothetical protein
MLKLLSFIIAIVTFLLKVEIKVKIEKIVFIKVKLQFFI